MHALIIGATGATGKDLLDNLINDHSVKQIDIFVRKQVDVKDEKLKVHIIDFDKPEKWKHLVKGDVLFSALGTTLKAAGSKEEQWKIDYEYQYQFALAARENEVPNYVLVSSANSSPDSMIFYSKMKGKLEEAVKVLGFQSLIIFRPPILERKGSDRTGEMIGLSVIRFFNKFGLLNKQKPMPTQVLAKAMVNAAKESDSSGLITLEAQQIWDRAQA